MTLFDPQGNILRNREMEKAAADAQLESGKSEFVSLEDDIAKARREGRSEDEKYMLDTMLLVRGLPGLDSPELVPRLAALIKNHEDFMGMIAETDDPKRVEMYEALRPHLTFKPWPLERYMEKIVERAGNAASSWAPVEIGDKAYKPVPAAMADKVLLTFSCYKCTRVERFVGDTVVSTAIQAREKGWVRDLVRDKEICPKCPAANRQKYGRA